MPTNDKLKITTTREPHILVSIYADDAPITVLAFRVYIHLLRRAGADNTAYPSYASIGEACFRSTYPNAKPENLRKMARQAIDQLVEAGMIAKTSQTRENGSAGNNIYTLTPTQAWTNSPLGVGGTPHLPQQTAGVGGTPHHDAKNEGGGGYPPPKEDPFHNDLVKEDPILNYTSADFVAAGAYGADDQQLDDPTKQTETNQTQEPATAHTIYTTIFGDRALTRKQLAEMEDTVANLEIWGKVLIYWQTEQRNPLAITQLLGVYRATLNQLARNRKTTEPQQPPTQPTEQRNKIYYDPAKFAATGLCPQGAGTTPYEVYREWFQTQLTTSVIIELSNRIHVDQLDTWRETVRWWATNQKPSKAIEAMIKAWETKTNRLTGTGNAWAAYKHSGAHNGNGATHTTNTPDAANQQLLDQIDAERELGHIVSVPDM